MKTGTPGTKGAGRAGKKLTGIFMIGILALMLALTGCSIDDSDQTDQTDQTDTPEVVQLDPAEVNGEVITYSDTQREVYTDIVIEATPEEVWAVLTDFANMPKWSSTFQGIEGDFTNGGQITARFLLQGQVMDFPHALILEDGVSFGWSEPVLIAPGVTDDHHYTVGETDGSRTRFIQSDTFNGAGETWNMDDLANLTLSGYMAFNAELKAEVERRQQYGDFILDPAEANGEIIVHSDTQHEVHTDIVIKATPAEVWAVLADFANMPKWSSTFQGIEGDFANGGQVTAQFLNQGQVMDFPHTLILEDGVSFGWSDPLLTIPGLTDDHHYIVGETDGVRTRFVQSDTMSAESAEAMANAEGLLSAAFLPMYMLFNQELKAEVERRQQYGDFILDPTEANGEVITHSDTQREVQTDIVIRATPDQVWTVLTDFASMPGWSSTFQGIEGDFTNGGQITAHFLNQGQVMDFPHALILENGVSFGWSEPVLIAPGVTDDHHYIVGETDGIRTRFIQSDTFNGTSDAWNMDDLANLTLAGYMAFNAELKAEVERRYGTAISTGQPDDQDGASGTPLDHLRPLDTNHDATLIYEAQLQIVDSVSFGVDMMAAMSGAATIPEEGVRLNTIFAGSTAGRLEGSLSGIDYVTVLPGGRMSVRVEGVIETTDGHQVALHADGGSEPGTDFWEIVTLTTNATPYLWVNDMYMVGTGTTDMLTMTTTLRVYGFEEDPFDGNPPYQKAPTPDYENFPLDSASLESDPDARLICEETLQSIGITSFGVDPNDVMLGNVTVPEEGIRMNGEIAGTTSGELTGDIMGIDYMTLLPGGMVYIDVEGSILTEEGHRVAMSYEGMGFPRADNPTILDVVETVRLTTYAEPLMYLNDLYLVGVGTVDQLTGIISISLYGFEEDPLSSGE